MDIGGHSGGSARASALVNPMFERLRLVRTYGAGAGDPAYSTDQVGNAANALEPARTSGSPSAEITYADVSRHA